MSDVERETGLGTPELGDIEKSGYVFEPQSDFERNISAKMADFGFPDSHIAVALRGTVDDCREWGVEYGFLSQSDFASLLDYRERNGLGHHYTSKAAQEVISGTAS